MRAVPGLQTTRAEAGWETFLQCGVSVPAETLSAIRACRGGPVWGGVLAQPQGGRVTAAPS